MVKIRKYANGIERFLHGEKGQRFFNFAYSIGAAIVIWGALFKILHLPGGSTLLCIGMGTEIAMFILTAFDRPPREYAWEDVFPVLDSKNPDDRPDFTGGGGVVVNGVPVEADGEPYALQAGVTPPVVSAGVVADPSAQLSATADLADASASYLEQMQGIAEQMARLNETTEALNNVTRTLLGSYQAITENSESVSANSQGYVSQMESLNRNNRGLKDIRDMYDKAANESSRYCEETEKMARYMKQLNSVYEKMITAMTINMANPMMGAAAAGVAQTVNPFDESVNTQNS